MSLTNYPVSGFGAELDHEIERGMELRGETRSELEAAMKFGRLHVEPTRNSLIDFWMRRAASWRLLRAVCQGGMDP